MRVIEFIKQKVAECGSQSAVSRKIGVSQPTINRYCMGDAEPNIDTIYKIAAAYGINPASFLQDTPIIADPDPGYNQISSLSPAQRKILEHSLTLSDDQVETLIRICEQFLSTKKPE